MKHFEPHTKSRDDFVLFVQTNNTRTYSKSMSSTSKKEQTELGGMFEVQPSEGMLLLAHQYFTHYL